MSREIRQHLDIDIQFHETDMLGVVHNAVYFLWFERGRMRILNEILPFEEAMQTGVALVVTRNECRYIHPARYPGSVRLITRVAWNGVYEGRFRFFHEVADTERRLTLAVGESDLALIHMAERKLVTHLPDHVIQRLNRVFGFENMSKGGES